MIDVYNLFFYHSISEDDPANGLDITSQIQGIDHFARLTNSSCFITDFDRHEMIYRSEHLLYVDEASNNELQRNCENPYWALVSEQTLAHLVQLKKKYPEGGKEIDIADYNTHICTIEYPIILHKKEVFVNQKFTPLVMKKDGITKIGLFVINPSTCDHLESFIITDSGQRWRFNFEKGIFHIYDLATTLTIIEKAILLRVQKGMTIDEIACDMSLSASTIKTHRRKIFDKLLVKTMPEALTVIANYNLM